MDLRQLNALLAVADRGSFSAAARALHTVQSNVSTHVARLEKELGATLIDRATGTLTADQRTALRSVLVGITTSFGSNRRTNLPNDVVAQLPRPSP